MDNILLGFNASNSFKQFLFCENCGISQKIIAYIIGYTYSIEMTTRIYKFFSIFCIKNDLIQTDCLEYFQNSKLAVYFTYFYFFLF